MTEFKKGQCFKCGDRWAPGHQRKTHTLHQMEGESPKEEDNDEEVIAELGLEEADNEGEVTLNDITYHSPPSTLKLSAKSKTKRYKYPLTRGVLTASLILRFCKGCRLR